MATSDLTDTSHSFVSDKQSTSVHGWGSDAYTRGDWTDPVVVNQSASAEHMVSWATAQIEQLNVLLGVIGCATHNQVEVDPAELVGSVRHQLEQVQAVLEGACSKLRREASKS